MKQANLRYYSINVYSTVFTHPSLITPQKRRDISNYGLLTGLFIHHSSFIVFLSFISITSSLISVFAFTYRIRQIVSTLEPIQSTHTTTQTTANSATLTQPLIIHHFQQTTPTATIKREYQPNKPANPSWPSSASPHWRRTANHRRCFRP